MKEAWCIPPEANAAFVCQMEDVLDVYHLPDDPRYPSVCFDETSKQLIGEIATPRWCYAKDSRSRLTIQMRFDALLGVE